MMTLRRLSGWSRWAYLGSLGAAACAGPAPQTVRATTLPTTGANASSSSAIRAELPARVELPFEAREMLAARMMRHGEQMTALMVGVLMLDYELTRRLADDLAEEPKLGRPAAGERGTLNALLPDAFFMHQDTLAESARELSLAAQLKNDDRIVSAFGVVAKSCVGCHSTYLHDELNMNFEHDEPEPLPDCEAGDVCEDGAGATDPDVVDS